MFKRSLNGRTRIFALGILAAVVSTQAYGQLPVSRPAAMLPISVTATSTTPIGVPFTREPAVRDVVSAVAGQDITGAAGGYGVGAFANTHIVLITTGASRGTGLPITANTATTLTVTGTVPALGANEDEFEIVPLQTLNALFGNPPINLTGGANAAAADKVSVAGTRYFFRTAAGWRLESAPFGPDQGNATIPNLAGVSIIRIGAATTTNVRGLNRSTRAVIPVPGASTTLLSWPYPGAVTLTGSGLSSTVQQGANAAAADKVSIGGIRYFFRTSVGWRLESAPFGGDQGAVVLNPGDRAFTVIRLGVATGHPVLESFVP